MKAIFFGVVLHGTHAFGLKRLGSQAKSPPGSWEVTAIENYEASLKGLKWGKTYGKKSKGKTRFEMDTLYKSVKSEPNWSKELEDEIKKLDEVEKKKPAADRATLIVLTMLGSLNPVHKTHLGNFAMARKAVLKVFKDKDPNAPAPHVIGLLSANSDAHIFGKQEDKLLDAKKPKVVAQKEAEAEVIPIGDRAVLIRNSIRDLGYSSFLSYTTLEEGKTKAELEKKKWAFKEILHYYMNGADDIVTNPSKLKGLSANYRKVTVGRIGSTEKVAAVMKKKQVAIPPAAKVYQSSIDIFAESNLYHIKSQGFDEALGKAASSSSVRKAVQDLIRQVATYQKDKKDVAKVKSKILSDMQTLDEHLTRSTLPYFIQKIGLRVPNVLASLKEILKRADTLIKPNSGDPSIKPNGKPTSTTGSQPVGSTTHKPSVSKSGSQPVGSTTHKPSVSKSGTKSGKDKSCS